MSEGSISESILLATSYQALYRIEIGNQVTLIPDCTIVILFAGFYIEAALNRIIDQTGKKDNLKKFYEKKRFLGLQDKLAWFYNEFVEISKAKNKGDLYKNGIKAKLEKIFPGYSAIYHFRNDISHGMINRSATSLEETIRLRQQAKDLVDQLYNITSGMGFDLPRPVTYIDAVESNKNDSYLSQGVYPESIFPLHPSYLHRKQLWVTIF